ncbi:MAG: hypothetical protein ABJN62_14545 [Halioglobus sp.]
MMAIKPRDKEGVVAHSGELANSEHTPAALSQEINHTVGKSFKCHRENIHTKGVCNMKLNMVLKKQLFLFAVVSSSYLGAVAANADSYNTIASSGENCSPMSLDDAINRPIHWRPGYVANQHDTYGAWVTCQMVRELVDYQYTATIRLANFGNVTREPVCYLKEFDAFGNPLKSIRRSVYLSPGWSSAVVFPVVNVADRATSSFSLVCKLPPKTALGTIYQGT